MLAGATDDQRRDEEEIPKALREEMEAVTNVLPPSQSRCANATKEKGLSTWLSLLPIEQLGFGLSKGHFRDAIALRYGW